MNVLGGIFLPNAEGWHDRQDDYMCSELEMMEFLAGLVRMLKPKLVVETGGHVGFTTWCLAEAVHRNGVGRVISCDASYEAVALARERCRNLLVDIRFCKSEEVPELAECDFLFCDSGYDSRLIELSLVRSPCTVVVHDTKIETPLEDYIQAHFAHFLFFPVSRGFTIIQV